MTEETPPQLENIRKYQATGIHYMENALAFLQAQEFQKASEFLSGSLTQAIKAVAAIKNIKLKNHTQL